MRIFTAFEHCELFKVMLNSLKTVHQRDRQTHIDRHRQTDRQRDTDRQKLKCHSTHCMLQDKSNKNKTELEMSANAQRDGRPAAYRWCPLFNAAVWLCSNAAKTPNPLKFAGVPQTNETISAASGPKFTILWGHVEEILLLNSFFSDCQCVP